MSRRRLAGERHAVAMATRRRGGVESNGTGRGGESVDGVGAGGVRRSPRPRLRRRLRPRSSGDWARQLSSRRPSSRRSADRLRERGREVLVESPPVIGEELFGEPGALELDEHEPEERELDGDHRRPEQESGPEIVRELPPPKADPSCHARIVARERRAPGRAAPPSAAVSSGARAGPRRRTARRRCAASATPARPRDSRRGRGAAARPGSRSRTRQ